MKKCFLTGGSGSSAQMVGEYQMSTGMFKDTYQCEMLDTGHDYFDYFAFKVFGSKWGKLQTEKIYQGNSLLCIFIAIFPDLHFSVSCLKKMVFYHCDEGGWTLSTTNSDSDGH